MPINQSNKIGFDLSRLNAPRGTGDKLDSADFKRQLAEFQTQNLNVLINAGNEGSSSGSDALSALSADGRNKSLFDPESGYDMMSLINQKEVGYKAEFAALSQMGDEILQVQGEGEDLTRLDNSTDNASIRKELQEFVEEYNRWVGEFSDEMGEGGALAQSNAAKVSRYELAQSLQNPFTGAQFGVKGLEALGLSVDPESGVAKLDVAKLDSALSGNKTAAVETLREFSNNFVKSAQLLNADNNFISNRLANLGRVVQYLDSNKTSLQAEFGLGDVASNLSANVTQALAAYGKMAKA